MHWFYDPTFSAESSKVRVEEVPHFKSLRIREGEGLVVTDGRGGVFLCEAANPVTGEVRVQSSEYKAPETLQIQLIQGIAKGDRDELALQASVELGCTSVVAWQAEHSVSRWTGKEDKNRERWQQIAIGAMKQSRQAFLPEVSGPLSTEALRPLGHGIILDPPAELSLAELDREFASYSIVVGPEGGISDSEIDQLKRAGFVSYRLGDAVMRTSTAGPAAIAALKTMRGLW